MSSSSLRYDQLLIAICIILVFQMELLLNLIARMVIDRVESRKSENILRFIKYAAGTILTATTIFIIWNWDKIDSLRLSHFKPFIPVITLGGGFYLQIAKQRGQFIEWSADAIEFNTQKVKGKFLISDIKKIDQSLDIITITLKNDENRTIDIQNFTKYEVRLRIKENFNKVANNLSSSSRN